MPESCEVEQVVGSRRRSSFMSPISPVEEDKVYRFVQLFETRSSIEIKEWFEISRWVKYEQDLDEIGRLGQPHVAPIPYCFTAKLNHLINNRSVLLLDPSESDLPATFRNVVDELLVKQFAEGAELDDIFQDLLLFTKPQGTVLAEGRKGSSARIRRGSLRVLSGKGEGEEEIDKLPRKDSIRMKRLVRQNTALIPPSRDRRVLKRRGTFSGLAKFLQDDTPAKDEKSRRVSAQIDDKEGTLILLRGGCTTVGMGAMVLVRFSNSGGEESSRNPFRFLIIFLSPEGMREEFTEIGRSVGTLISDNKFNKGMLSAENKEGILTAFSDFFDRCIILPPGIGYIHNFCQLLPLHVLQEKEILILQIRDDIDNKDRLSSIGSILPPQSDELGALNSPQTFPTTFHRHHKLFGGMINDLKEKILWYKSDLVDGFNSQTVSTTIFLYFTTIAPNVTFGGLLEEKTAGFIGVSETLVAASSSGIIFALLGGQPLNVIAPTGPLLIFDEQLFLFMEMHAIEFLPARVWISLWVLIITIVVASLEGSAIVKYISRFTMEIFSALSSLIFVYEGLEVSYRIFLANPLTKNGGMAGSDEYEGESEQKSNFVVGQPNTAIMSAYLMFGTFIIAYKLKRLKLTNFFPKKIRDILSDFGVPVAIIFMVMIDYRCGVKTTKTQVPSGLSPTMPGKRGWVVSPFGIEKPFNYWMPLITILPGGLIFLIMFMTVEICEKILLTRGGFKKAFGLHWDPVVLAVTNLACGICGLPWMSIAVLRTFAHVEALTVYSKNNPPGMPPTIVKIRENRLSGLFMSVMMGASVFLAPVLKLIPVPVLFGIFLFMGVTSFKPTQLCDRIVLFFTSKDAHPQTVYVRRVPTWKIHLYTVIQIITLVFLWVVKSIKEIAIFFPVVLMLLPPIRQSLKFLFTEAELDALDHETRPLPAQPPTTSDKHAM
ncbi:anion exchange protein 2 [Folsomia candida]|uniref:anion exchange protein 2 n=1 Tax=Folsomia candida TaxID=158441 RepID=UPI001604C5C0|nr:anion exchange protein 2 [Folsomia candida]